MTEDNSPKVCVKYDKETGQIQQTVRGRNMSLDFNDWEDVTNDPKMLTLIAPNGPEKMMIVKDKRGVNKLRWKPQIKLHIDKTEMDADGSDRVIVRAEVTKHMLNKKDTIKVRVNSQTVDLLPGEELEIKSSVANRLTVCVDDPRALCKDKHMILAKNPGYTPPVHTDTRTGAKSSDTKVAPQVNKIENARIQR